MSGGGNGAGAPATDPTPAFVLLYGPSGAGKTTDLLYSFPRAVFIAQPGGLKPSRGVVGYLPAKTEQIQSIEDAIRLIEQIAKSPAAYGNPDGIVIDDFSMLSDVSFSRLEATRSGHKLWGGMRDLLLRFRMCARFAGLHIAVNAHERAPHHDDRKGFIRGGPNLPGTMPEDLPVACDLVLRVVYEPARLGWPYVVRCSPAETQFVTRDRDGACPDMAPLNTAEILRLNGYSIRRAPGLDWQEGVVEKVAGLLSQLPPDNAIVTRFLSETVIPQIRSRYTQNDLHIRWTLRDAVDRTVLRRARQVSVLSGFTAPAVPA